MNFVVINEITIQPQFSTTEQVIFVFKVLADLKPIIEDIFNLKINKL